LKDPSSLQQRVTTLRTIIVVYERTPRTVEEGWVHDIFSYRFRVFLNVFLRPGFDFKTNFLAESKCSCYQEKTACWDISIILRDTKQWNLSKIKQNKLLINLFK